MTVAPPLGRPADSCAGLQVFRAYDLQTGTDVALKVHTVEAGAARGAREYVKRAVREVAILEELRHTHIVRLLQVFQITEASFAIVMEACPGARHSRSAAPAAVANLVATSN